MPLPCEEKMEVEPEIKKTAVSLETRQRYKTREQTICKKGIL